MPINWCRQRKPFDVPVDDAFIAEKPGLFSKMIILHITTDTNYGGVQQCVLGICRHSAVHGHRFTHHILRISAGNLESKFRKYATIHDAGANHENCISLIRSIKPDIVHMHMPGGEFPEYAEQIARAGAPLIENIHCVKSATPREEEVMRARIVNSRYVQSLQRCQERLHVIPHAIDEEEWSELPQERVQEELREIREKELNIPQSTPAVGRLGNIMPWKKVTDFVHAVPLILRGAINCPIPAFLVAGAVHENPAYAAGVLRAARMLFVENKIRFLWNIPQRFVFLGMLDIFLYPTSREGFCIAALEAMAMGLPVVTYDDSAMPETVTSEAGVLAIKGDINGLAGAVISLLENPRLLKAKSDAARALVMRRNMPVTVFPRYEQLYEQCA
jgi:glycosyltransferase involved in cell wall biosynthesis